MTEKVYLENPYLRQIEARIIEKKYKNNKYYIKTNKTIFYPNLAGGQPGDKGTINDIKVIDAYEDGEDIIHVTKSNIHSDKAKLSIDWDTRFDYMQQHSGQHLLSSVFYKLLNAETIGFFIGDDYVYIDINIPEIGQKDLRRAEEFANKIVFSNFLIKTYTIEKNELNNIPIREETARYPKTRIVEIDQIDFSPCCGTHLRSTGEIGIIKIRNIKPFKEHVRIEFLCGNRALNDYIWKDQYIKDISKLLSCEDKDIKNRIEGLLEENKSLKDSPNKLKNN